MFWAVTDTADKEFPPSTVFAWINDAVRNMVINYPNYLFTFTLIFYPIIKNIFIISRQWDMSRNDTSAIYKSTYYLGLVHVKLTTDRKASWSFNLPSCSGKHFVWNTFGTPVQPPQSLAWDQSLWVARHTFLWVLLTHRNFTKDLGMLGKSLQTVWRSC
jgi:hypothetical protein